jgi:hypothetical protein
VNSYVISCIDMELNFDDLEASLPNEGYGHCPECQTIILHICGLSPERTSLEDRCGLLTYFFMVYVMVLLVTQTM